MSVSNSYIHETFVFCEYNSGLQLGTGHGDDHNGVISTKVDTLVEAVIPSYINDKTVIRIGYRALRNLPNLQTAFIPKTIREMDGDVFVFCHSLTTVIFEENSELEIMRQYIFYETGIYNVIFPSSVKYLGVKCFFNCKNLKSVVITGFLECNHTDTFEKTPQTVKIYVPSNYEWDTFGDRSVIKILPAYQSTSPYNSCKQTFIQIPKLYIDLFILISV